MTNHNNSSAWGEAKKGNPCPLCEKNNWCNISPDREAVQCDRTDKHNPPPGWDYIKDGRDGRPVFKKIDEKKSLPWKNNQRVDHLTRNNELALLPESSEPSETITLEGEEDKRARDFLKNQKGKNIPDDSPISMTIYHYSPEQRVIRHDWQDPTKEKGRDKIFIQKHFDKLQNKWIFGKGEKPWPAYNQKEVLEKAKENYLLFLEGEKNVDQARFIRLTATTLQGSSWGDDEIKNLVQKAKNAEAKLIIKWADGDSTGQKKAEKVRKVCDELQMPLKSISNKDFIPDAKEKDDIEEAITQLKGEEVIRLLQEIANNFQADDPFQQETQKQKQEYRDLMNKVDHILEKYPDISTQRYLLQELAKKNKRTLKDLIDLSQLREASQDKFEPISAQEICRSEVIETQWVIPRMVARGATYLLAGDGGVGKTLLVYSLIKQAIAQGHTVLFVSADDPPCIMKKRIQKHGLDSEKLFIETSFSFHQLSKLESWARDRVIDFIITDSLTTCSMFSEFSENDPGYAFPLYKANKFADHHNLAILIIHHVSKQSGTSRGTTAIRNAVSESWILRKDEKNPQLRVLTVDKYRLEIDKAKRFYAFGSNGLLTETDPPRKDTPSREPTTAERIDILLYDGQTRSSKQITQELGIPKSTVDSALKRMIDLGEVICKVRGLEEGGRRVNGYMTPGGQEDDDSELDLDIPNPDSAYCGQKPWEEN